MDRNEGAGQAKGQDIRTEKEKMLAGELYDAAHDPETGGEHYVYYDLCTELNRTDPRDDEKRAELLKKICGRIGPGTVVESPFVVDLGYDLDIGRDCFIGAGTVMLATNRITIGDGAVIERHCSFSCAGHPIDTERRALGLEYGYPITIGKNAHIGMGTCIVPGVTIGDNAYIAPGSVVVDDIPAGYFAEGVPCRPKRLIKKLPKDMNVVAVRDESADETAKAEEESRAFGILRMMPSEREKRREAVSGMLAGLGEGSYIEPFNRLLHAENIKIGAGSFINFDCCLDGRGGIDIGDHVLIAPGCMISTSHSPEDPSLREAGAEVTAPVAIEDSVWLGAGCRVLPGVTIGEASVIAAGSVVTHDIPKGVLAAGYPCEPVRELTEKDSGRYELADGGMTEREKEYSGKLYDALVPEFCEERIDYYSKCRVFNDTKHSDFGKRKELMYDILPNAGKDLVIFGPFIIDQGYNFESGDGCFINHNCIMLASARIRFGSRVNVAPNCIFSCAGHPFDRKQRDDGLEYALPITIEDDVWIGEGCRILPGVTVGKGSVIGAGSVVAHDIPAGVVAAGVPCRPVREITEKDRQGYIDSPLDK
jgi:galactoside O-acetyltransferase